MDFFEDDSSRELSTCTFANGTIGTRCTGSQACENQSYTSVACGSCNGDKSCWGVTMAQIEEGSCVGEKSCYMVTGSAGGEMMGVDERGYSLIGVGSCVGYASCSYFMGEFFDMLFDLRDKCCFSSCK